MGERIFQMRLFCRYHGPDNAPADLRVENLEGGEWRSLDLNLRSPGFVVFVYGLFSCQHLYLRTNAAQRGLILDFAHGSIEVAAAEDWSIRKRHVHFDAHLKAGAPSASDVSYIVGRMKQCPVSRNLREIPDAVTVVELAEK